MWTLQVSVKVPSRHLRRVLKKCIQTLQRRLYNFLTVTAHIFGLCSYFTVEMKFDIYLAYLEIFSTNCATYNLSWRGNTTKSQEKIENLFRIIFIKFYVIIKKRWIELILRLKICKFCEQLLKILGFHNVRCSL